MNFTYESCFLNCFTKSKFVLFLVVYSSGSHCGESYVSEFLWGLKEFCIKFSTLYLGLAVGMELHTH